MKKETKLLAASLIFFAVYIVGILIMLAANIGSEMAGIIVLIPMVCYVVFFLLFLFVNHTSMKAERQRAASLRGYRSGIAITSILLIAGIVGASIGARYNADYLIQIMGVLASISVVPLIYCVIGFSDIWIRKRTGNTQE